MKNLCELAVDGLILVVLTLIFLLGVRALECLFYDMK